MSTKMKTLTINDVTYDIIDDSAVSFVEEQHLTEAQKAQARANIGAQPVGEYLTEVPEGYAKNEDIKKVDRKVDTLREVVSKFHSNIVCDSKGEVITVSDASDMELAGLRIFGKTTQNGTPTPDAPVLLESVGADGNVAVTVCGKNLLNMPEKTMQNAGVKVYVSGSAIIFSGTATGAYGDLATSGKVRIQPGTYTFSAKNIEKILRIEFAYTYDDGVTVSPIFILASNPKCTFKITKPCYLRITFVLDKGSVFGDDTNPTSIYMQLEKGATATDYEPYKDGGTLTAQTPNGLPGIPVSSGGNYTDENGQMWICDEIDFARGKYVQKVVQKRMQNLDMYSINNQGLVIGFDAELIDKVIKDMGMCNALPLYTANNQFGSVESCFAVGYYGALIQIAGFTTMEALNAYLAEHEVIVQVAWKEPIEHTLRTDQLAAFAALHTNYPNTTVFNDKNAGMEVKYVADTKLYIDKKFAELSAALLNQ